MSLDRKGLTSYLTITFGLTWLIEGLIILAGFRASGLPQIRGQLVIAAVMWVPALATLLTVKYVTREGFAITNLRLGPLRPYLFMAFAIPAAYALIYTLTTLLGLGRPDWQLQSFRALMASGGATGTADFSSATALIGIFGATLFITPFINSVFGFGEEFGWRGYLLPKLMPLGKAKAYLLVGVIWGLWHAPLVLVGFNYPGYPFAGILGMSAMTTAFSLFMNELTLRYRSSILAGWIHGLLNSQGYGIWRILFPNVNPLLGGFTGLVGIAVFAALGWWTIRRPAPTQAA